MGGKHNIRCGKNRTSKSGFLFQGLHLMIMFSNSFFMQVNIDLVSDKSVNEVALPDGTVVSRSNLSQVVASSCSDLAPLSLRYHLTFPELYDTFNCTP